MTAGITLTRPSRVDPSWANGLALCPGEAAYPSLWTGLRRLWSPELGPTGLELPELAEGSDGTLTGFPAGAEWEEADGYWGLKAVGSDDQVNVPSLAMTSPWTLLIWLRVSAVNNTFIVPIGSDTSNYVTRRTSTSEYRIVSGGTNRSITAATPILDAWQLWVIRSTPDTWYFEIDGVEETTTRTSAPDTITIDRLANWWAAYWSTLHLGMVAVWDRTLDPGETLLCYRDRMAITRLADSYLPEVPAAAVVATPDPAAYVLTAKTPASAAPIEPTGYTTRRNGDHITVTVWSNLDTTRTIFYHWYLDGAYVGQSTTPSRTIYAPPGTQVGVEVHDTVDPAYDPIANAPGQHAPRRTLWWVRTVGEDPGSYRVEQQQDGGAWSTIAEIPADPTAWQYFVTTERLEDLASYAWRVTAIDLAGNAGTPLAIDAETVVRTPDGPIWGYTFDDGTQRITISES
jgi:hypothetical protein